MIGASRQPPCPFGSPKPPLTSSYLGIREQTFPVWHAFLELPLTSAPTNIRSCHRSMFSNSPRIWFCGPRRTWAKAPRPLSAIPPTNGAPSSGSPFKPQSPARLPDPAPSLGSCQCLPARKSLFDCIARDPLLISRFVQVTRSLGHLTKSRLAPIIPEIKPIAGLLKGKGETHS